MLPCLSRRRQQFVASGNYIVRNTSSFDRNRRYYDLTVDAEEQEIKNRPNPLADVEARINASKQKLVWRQTPTKPFSFGSEILGMFATERQRATYLQRVSQPFLLELSWSKFMEAREKRRQDIEALLQLYIPERHEILGNNLAAAHFLVHRGASVR